MQWTKQYIRAVLLANWYWIAVAVIALGLIVYAVGAVNSCRENGWQKKIERTKDGIIANKAEANVLANQAVNQRNEVNKNAENTNQAFSNFNNSLNRDSNQYSGANDAATDRFCRKFSNDSSCAEWRRLHGM